MFRFSIAVILIFFPWHISIAETDSIISKIQTGWNDIQTMSGEFSQIDSDGNLETGKFYFLKPYQSKFVYANKDEDIVTNETLLRIIDKKGFQIDSYAIGGNALKKLLSKNLDIKQSLQLIMQLKMNSTMKFRQVLKMLVLQAGLFSLSIKIL
jgi:outer membrane lipoprotein-sorting protein